MRCIYDCSPQPSSANAGLDQLEIHGISTALAGNYPANGTGMWAIVSGTGGTIVDLTSPTSQFQGVTGNEYALSWTIATPCGSSTDEVVISFYAFSCGDYLLDTREGQTYSTVQIGTQCWMAENLKIGTMITSIAGGQLQTDNGEIEKYCYNNDANICKTYGGLYEWNEAMQYATTEAPRGICPYGWHLPTDNEWKVLEGTVDSEYPAGDEEWDGTGWRGSDAGGNMKETGILRWTSPNQGATNSSGFSGRPGGYRKKSNGNFFEFGNSAYFWSSSLFNSPDAWDHYLGYDEARIGRNSAHQFSGYSVRCILGCLP